MQPSPGQIFIKTIIESIGSVIAELAGALILSVFSSFVVPIFDMIAAALGLSSS